MNLNMLLAQKCLIGDNTDLQYSTISHRKSMQRIQKEKWTLEYLRCVVIACRLYSKEVAHSSTLNQTLGIGIGIFQGLSNVALNGVYFSQICHKYFITDKRSEHYL